MIPQGTKNVEIAMGQRSVIRVRLVHSVVAFAGRYPRIRLRMACSAAARKAAILVC
jgi:hypothetical protein